MKALSLFFGLFLSFSLLADGIPMDKNGNITVPHTVIKIDKEQQVFLENHRYLKLSLTQKTMLGENWNLNEIEILDPHHNDCKCARVYALWISPDEIAFLNRDIFPKKDDPGREEFKQMCKENISWYTEKKEMLMYIGINGQLYYSGKIITAKDIITILEKTPLKYLVIFTAPRKNNKNWEQIEKIQDEIKSLKIEDVEIIWT